MKKLKKSRFFSIGRMWVFTLALFLLVFSAASVIKVHALGNFRGWPWGGTEDRTLGGNQTDCLTYPSACVDGNETGVYWSSVNSLNCDANFNGESDGTPAGCPPAGTKIPEYGLSIPDSDGPINTNPNMNGKNYVWSPNLFWISFEPADVSGCPATADNPNCTPTKQGDQLTGWARIIGIRDAGLNAAGWKGWVSLSGKTQGGQSYGLRISDMTGAPGGHTYAWSEELGWIDFGQAYKKTCPAITCQTVDICEGKTFQSCDASFCGGGLISCTPSGITWNCLNDCADSKACATANVIPIQNGQCGTANGLTICDGHALSADELCATGTLTTPTPDLSGYTATWQCGGICGGATSGTCTAQGVKSCGWMETN